MRTNSASREPPETGVDVPKKSSSIVFGGSLGETSHLQNPFCEYRDWQKATINAREARTRPIRAIATAEFFFAAAYKTKKPSSDEFGLFLSRRGAFFSLCSTFSFTLFTAAVFLEFFFF